MDNTKEIISYNYSPSSPRSYKKLHNKLNEEFALNSRKNQQPEGSSDFREESLITGTITEEKQVQTEYFKQWEGRVISIENDSEFIARLEPISANDKIRIVKFNKAQIQIVNSQYFEEGAVFYWTVGLLHKGGTKTLVKSSEVRFRLLPPPNPWITKEAEERARKVFDGISWLE